MAEDGIAGPAGVFDLGDEPRRDPVDALARRALGQGDGGIGAGKGIEPMAQIAELHRTEPGPDPSGIAQLAGRIIIADEQGANTLPLAFRIAEADDDEFLAIAALDLEPGAAAPRTVGCVAALRDDAFQAEAARLAKNGRAVAGLVVAVAQDPLGLQRNDSA